MPRREVAWLCRICDQRGRMAPVFLKMADLLRHTSRVYKLTGTDRGATIEVAARRVMVSAYIGKDTKHGRNASSNGRSSRGGREQSGSPPPGGGEGRED